jgi:Histidine biosynthesis protein
MRVARGTSPRLSSAPEGRRPAGPSLMPCIMLRHGRICRPGEDGPVPARRPDGKEFDVFDVLDVLSPNYSSVYLVDLDGIERNDPQLEYIQEISRETTLWVDSGVRRADQAIDILVAGAERAVLSSSYLEGPRELKRAWRLSPELVFEIELANGGLAPIDPAWGATDPASLAAAGRGTGPDSVILSPRGEEPDWNLVAVVAAAGPTWVDGTFTLPSAPRLAEARAAGGIFHIDGILDAMDPT